MYHRDCSDRLSYHQNRPSYRLHYLFGIRLPSDTLLPVDFLFRNQVLPKRMALSQHLNTKHR